MSAVLTQLRSYTHADGTSGATLRDVARESGQALAQMKTPRPAATVNRARSAAPASRPAGQTPRRFTYAEVDALGAQVPAGRYALPKKADADDVTFFEVIEGRNGAHMIRMLVGAPGSFQTYSMKLNMQFFAFTHLLEDLKAAAVLFGRKTRTCGICGSPLTKKASRDAGIGPKCAKKVG